VAEIIYDHREESSGIPALLLLEGIEVRSESLVVADYLLTEEICVERKSAADFVASLKDGRLFRQAENMKENYKSPILLVEGKPSFASLSVSGAIASLVRRGITFLSLESEKETVEVLSRIAVQEEKKKSLRKPNIKRKSRDANEVAEDVLAALPGISIGKAQNILNHFKSLQNVSQATGKELQQIEGIGKKTADSIAKQFCHLYGKEFWKEDE
jgi:ERCC4-type nuclease